MADMYVPMIWLPLGRVDLDAGLHAIDRLGDEGLVAALSVDSDEDPIGGWVLDLLEDLAVYDRSGPVEAPAEVVSPSQAARTFAAALSRVTDPQIAVRGLVHRMDLPGGGALLAAGGEWGGDTPVSAATLHCAIEVFPAVADAMGAIPPARWAISAVPPGDEPG